DRVVELVQARLEDSEAMVREVATLGLADLGWEKAGEVLIGALRSEHPEVRVQAFAAAATSGDGRGGVHVLRALEDEDRFVRASAVHAAGLLEADARPPSLLGKLRGALQDADPGVRCEAAIALAGLGEAGAADGLLVALEDKEHVLDALEVAPRVEDP